jgi:uncharacterized membrane protein YheB (UPF0754 family)
MNGFFTPLWLLIPFISGMIGWVTNYIAVKMLFYPREQKSILGLKIHGLLPRRHKDLARQISLSVEKELLTSGDLEKIISSMDFKPFMQKLIYQKWNEKISEILSLNPLIQMFLSADKLDEIRDRLIEVMFKGESDLSGQLAVEISNKMNIANYIEEKILDFDLGTLEAMVEKIAEREFRYIENLGGVLGFLIGLVQVLLVYLIQK